MKALIFAAGLGTRLRPLTDHLPKALVEIEGRTLLDLTIERLIKAQATEIVVNVHHFAHLIKAHLAAHHYPIPVRISDESDGLLETGGGIKKAAPLFDASSPVLIHNVDILSNVDLRRLYSLALDQENSGETDAVLLVSDRKTKRYFLFNDDMELVGWTNIETGEVKSPWKDLDVSRCHKFAFAGIHVISPRMFELMDSYPDKFGITDFYIQACAIRKIVGHVKPDLKLMDIGKLDTLAQAEEFLGELGQD